MLFAQLAVMNIKCVEFGEVVGGGRGYCLVNLAMLQKGIGMCEAGFDGSFYSDWVVFVSLPYGTPMVFRLSAAPIFGNVGRSSDGKGIERARRKRSYGYCHLSRVNTRSG